MHGLHIQHTLPIIKLLIYIAFFDFQHFFFFLTNEAGFIMIVLQVIYTRVRKTQFILPLV